MTAPEAVSAPTTYKRPPGLLGYTVDPWKAYAARDQGRLLAIRLETNKTCNLQCRYCYAESGSSKVLPLAQLKDVVRQAGDLGAESIVVIGGGEPTIHPDFRALMQAIAKAGILPMIFTNTLTMSPDLARFLHDHNVSVMGKLDSLRPEVQDFLVGQQGVHERLLKGLDALLEAGYGDPPGAEQLRLGISFVSNRLNLDELEDVWHFCRRRKIFPNMEVLTPTGRARDELDQYGLGAEEIQAYKEKLLELDRKAYGYDWLPHTPLTASGCLQHLYSLYITIDGDVRPCAPTKFDEHPALQEDGVYPHNIHRRTLRDIYEDDLFVYVRNIEKHLVGRCKACDHIDECIGCRGYAYSVGVNNGLDPRTALRQECQQCFRA